MRWATRREQALNKRHKRSNTGIKGVIFMKDRNKFRAQINIGDGKSVKLGDFSTIEEARAAYEREAAKPVWTKPTFEEVRIEA